MEHFLISTTMLVVGLFAVLSWDAIFPDRRDVLVLAPLPVRARTLFLAKVAGVASALALTVSILHVAAGVVWPLALDISLPAQTVPALTSDPALPPTEPAVLEALLNRDLAPALASGALAPGTGAGVAIGVTKLGARRVFTYGTARPDSVFEIGSITKTFTGLLLARMAVRGQVRLEDPVRGLLPEGAVTKPRTREITLLDLGTHHSGLPPMPGNLNPDGEPNPGADYHAADLYDYLGRRGVAKPPETTFAYSNLGFGLLGQALADRAGTTYANLMLQQITGPLGMPDTAVALSAGQQGRLIQGYNTEHRPVPAWDLDALAGAGAIRSTAGDMLTYLEANLYPEKLPSGLRDALLQSHQLRADVAPGMRIALAWIRNTDTGIYWHNGAISGYSSYAFFHPGKGYAAVVLLNQAPGFFPFAEVLGEHIRQRLAGEPAVSLASVLVPASGGVLGLVRVFAVYWIVMVASGAFLFCCVLGVQGLAAQLLPRRMFLRASSFLQLAAFCLFVSVYFLQPVMATEPALIRAQGHGLLAWSPSYWFLGLFQQLNGSPALAVLARRAWIGLAIAAGATGLAYTLSYFRTLRQIVEEPDIAPAMRRATWLPRFGGSLPTAVVRFSARTLLRSRRHRVILAFYLGIGFAITIFLLKTPVTQPELSSVASPWNQVNVPMLASSIVLMCFWVVGIRVVFSIPLDLEANWVFRVTPVRGGTGSLAARRRALLLLAVAPVWLCSAVVFLSLWPWRPAAAYLAILLLLGLILTEIFLHGAQKIPFTCSYLPGKANIHLAFWFGAMVLAQLLNRSAGFVRRALEEPATYEVLIGVLAAVAAGAWWWNTAQARKAQAELQFENAPLSEVVVLGLDSP